MSKKRIWNLKSLKEGDLSFYAHDVAFGGASIGYIEKYKGKPGYFIYGTCWRVVPDIGGAYLLMAVDLALVTRMAETICTLKNNGVKFDFDIAKRAKVSTWEKKLKKAGLV